MRLASPVYESMPIIYAGIGVMAFLVAYADPEGVHTLLAFTIALVAETAALTIFLRRQDYRARRREYAGSPLRLPR